MDGWHPKPTPNSQFRRPVAVMSHAGVEFPCPFQDVLDPEDDEASEAEAGTVRSIKPSPHASAIDHWTVFAGVAGHKLSN